MLDVKNLTIGYEGKPVVKALNFHVNEGDYLCIVGENGAGKSTLVKTLLKLVKPIEGSFSFKEKGIGYLPQQTIVQKDFPATVWEIVMSGNLPALGYLPFYREKHRIIARNNMEKMGILDLQKKSYRNLSGGQQQRVLLARALCTSGKILFMDEPVSGLDPKATRELYDLTEELKESGTTIIMVSHDLDMVMDYASHILHIGKDSVFYGTKQEYLSSGLSGDLRET